MIKTIKFKEVLPEWTGSMVRAMRNASIIEGYPEGNYALIGITYKDK